MLRRFAAQGVCWLLSLVLLLSNGWPVTVQHAHHVAGDPYHHRHQPEPSPWSGRQGGGQQAVAEELALADVTEHVHVLWLGWELTMVTPHGDAPPSSPASAVGILARLVQHDAAEAVVIAPIVARVVDWLPQGIVMPRAEIVYGQDDGPARLAALPLCETARHDRSGVQLI